MDCSRERNDSRSWEAKLSAEPSSRVPPLSTDVEPRARGAVAVGNGQLVVPARSRRDQRKSAERCHPLALTGNTGETQQRRGPRLHATATGSAGSIGMRWGEGRVASGPRDRSLPRPKKGGRDEQDNTNKNKNSQQQDASLPSTQKTSRRPHGKRQPQKHDHHHHHHHHHHHQRTDLHVKNEFFGNFDDTQYWDYAFRLTNKSDMGHHCRECRRPFVQLNEVVAVRRGGRIELRYHESCFSMIADPRTQPASSANVGKFVRSLQGTEAPQELYRKMRTRGHW